MGCGEMKRRGNRAAKGGMEMEIYMGNQKRSTGKEDKKKAAQYWGFAAGAAGVRDFQRVVSAGSVPG